MITTPEPPCVPPLELTKLLCRDGPRHLETKACGDQISVVRRDDDHVVIAADRARCRQILTAMLAPVHDGWTIDGVPARLIKPPLQNTLVSVTIHQRGAWHAVAMNGKQDLLPNCRINGILTWLPGPEILARRHFCALPSQHEHWCPTGIVTIQPLPELKAEVLGLEQRTPTIASLLSSQVKTILRRRSRRFTKDIAEAMRHPLTPTPTEQTVWRQLPEYNGSNPPLLASPGIKPIRLRYTEHSSRAEQNSVRLALLAENHGIVPVQEACRLSRSGAIVSAYALQENPLRVSVINLDPALAAVTLLEVDGSAKTAPLGLLAMKRYQPERYPHMTAVLSRECQLTQAQAAERLMLCYGPDLLKILAQEGASTAQAIKRSEIMAKHARRTAAALLDR